MFDNLVAYHVYQWDPLPTNDGWPTCATQAIHQALQLFMEESLFNADLSRSKCQSYPEDARQLWVELDGRQRFPLVGLVPVQLTL
jgi:hypothetical protein